MSNIPNIPTSEVLNNSTLDYSYSYGNSESTNKLLSINISGIILDTKPQDNPFSLLLAQEATYGYEVKSQLIEAADDLTISGVILEISSPGGTIAGSNAIAEGVAYYRENSGKPIISHVMGMAASGAYWTASSTDYIIADSGSLTGSIGVIFGPFQEYSSVLANDIVTTKDGINEFYITGGGFKDFGNPYRKMTDEEKGLLQQGINNEYDIFVKFVSSRRNISETQIKQTLKALVYDNVQALSLKLIDKTGSLDSAYDYLADKANFGTDYQIVKINTTEDFWGSLFGKILSPAYISASSQINTKSCQHLCYKPVVVYGNPVELDK
jgi:protease-4